MTNEDTPTPAKRHYHSARRQAQARETRQQIVAAAGRLFTAHGYTGTTMDAIAREAGVAVETVYAVFGNKRAVLARLTEVAVVGEDAPLSLAERPEAREIQREQDQRRQIHLFAHETSALMERSGPVVAILRSAAAAEPEIAALLQELLDKRLDAMRQFVRWVARNGLLRAQMPVDEAADLVWTLASPEVHQLLTGDRSWTEERYERWLEDTLIALLLPPP